MLFTYILNAWFLNVLLICATLCPTIDYRMCRCLKRHLQWIQNLQGQFSMHGTNANLAQQHKTLGRLWVNLVHRDFRLFHEFSCDLSPSALHDSGFKNTTMTSKGKSPGGILGKCAKDKCIGNLSKNRHCAKLCSACARLGVLWKSLITTRLVIYQGFGNVLWY